MNLDNTLFDNNTINELKDILEDDIYDIYTEFKHDADDILLSLKNSIANNDIESIIHRSHTLKGAAGNIGLKLVSELSKNIEHGLRNGNEIDLPDLLEQLNNAVQQTLSALTESGLLKNE